MLWRLLQHRNKNTLKREDAKRMKNAKFLKTILFGVLRVIFPSSFFAF